MSETQNDETIEELRAERDRLRERVASLNGENDLALRVAKGFDAERNEVRKTVHAIDEENAKLHVALRESRAVLRRALVDNQILSENLEATQKRGTDLVNERRATLRTRVREFFVVAGQAMPETPGAPSDDVVRFRLRLVAEEFFELLDASLDSQTVIDSLERGHEMPALIEHVGGAVVCAILMHPLKIDLSKFTDALADLDYVVEGARIAFGIDGGPVMDEVHRANLAKLGGPRREDGKLEKPPGWMPPNIAAVLRAQGWKG